MTSRRGWGGHEHAPLATLLIVENRVGWVERSETHRLWCLTVGFAALNATLRGAGTLPRQDELNQ